MRKILIYIFLFFGLIEGVYASSELEIISRAEWGANESFRYLDGPEWTSILEKRKKANDAWRLKLEKMSDSEREIAKAHSEETQAKTKEMNSILLNEYYDDNKIISKVSEENGNRLAWPIMKTNTIGGIIVHHTMGNYKTSKEGVQKIYKYHALTKGWGDIGYNFLIGENGEIYEGRAGGDKTVAAHSIWNNRSTVGIAIIGDYSVKPINQAQYNSLKILIGHIFKKYNIDTTKKFNYHKKCLDENCEKPLKSFSLRTIVGHKDTGYTSDPGDALYAQINKINDYFVEKRKIYIKSKIYLVQIKKKLKNKIGKIKDNDSLKLLEYVENRLKKSKKEKDIEILEIVQELIIQKFNNFISNLSEKTSSNNPNIKIKLSYPEQKEIVIKNGNKINSIVVKGKNLVLDGKKHRVLKISPKNTPYLEITSWNRKPAWDSKKIYNDNKFRGDIILYVKGGKLIVVNQLSLEDYLKGLGEISDSENPEKIKTIIIAARSYAKWYTGKNRKFPGEWYDGSDDPKVFQKYLGYGLESRSPNINKIVDETYGEFITYKGKLIKPWYSSSSGGKTLSFKEYCSINNDKNFCEEEFKKYPYLQGIKDPGSKGIAKNGHGVGISGIGTSYFAKKGWTAEMIIKYFLNGVEIGNL